MWAIMGPKAKVTPFDLVACQGMITLGKTKIVFSQNGLDMMDVRAEQVDKVVAVRKDLTSVRMPIENTGGTFNAPVTYSELGSAGYEVWIESKMC